MSAENTVHGEPTGHAGPVPVEETHELPPPEGEARLAVVEALLFSAAAPLHPDQLATLTGLHVDDVHATFAGLRDKYGRGDSGLALMEVAGGFQIATRGSVSEWVFRLHGHRRRSPITPALLETLAIVAYKQPVTRAEIEAIRGVDCGAVMRSLLDAGLAEIVGRKEVPGRPALYGTTDVFLKTFGLRSLEDLPAPGGLAPRPTEESAPRPPDESTQVESRTAEAAGETSHIP